MNENFEKKSDLNIPEKLLDREIQLYEQDLYDLYLSIRSDLTKLDDLLDNTDKLPKLFGLHTYFTDLEPEGTDNSEYAPDEYGKLVISSLVDLVVKFKEVNPGYKCRILVAGGHEYMSKDESYSSLYKSYLEKQLQRKLGDSLSDSVEVIKQNESDSKDMAVDTRGEIEFFKSKTAELNNVEQSIVLIGVSPHVKRIQILADNNNLKASTLSAEGIIFFLKDYDPRSIEGYIQLLSPEISNSSKSFSKIERIKLMLMAFDKKGLVLETVARLTGEFKQRFLIRISKRKN